MMPTHEEKRKSIKGLEKLLRYINNNPREYISNDKIQAALNSQGAMAKFDDEKLGIVSCALNTQKDWADEFAKDGYSAINLLRTNAQQAIKDILDTPKGSNKTTLSGQKKFIEEQERDIVLLQRQNLMLIALVRQLKSRLTHYASSDSETNRTNLEHDLDEFRAKVRFTNNSVLIDQVLNDD